MNVIFCYSVAPLDRLWTVAYRGGGLGCSTPPPRNSEDIGGVLEHMSKKNRRLDFLL